MFVQAFFISLSLFERLAKVQQKKALPLRPMKKIATQVS
jgi:hypothetical protein